MNRRHILKIGWLPFGQLFVLAASVATFAILARVLEPAAFARYATLILVYTAVSLLSDLSGQSYVLVNEMTGVVLRHAKLLVVISTVVAIVLLTALLICVAPFLPDPHPFVPAEFVILVVSIFMQNAMQVQRGRLIAHRWYSGVAAIELSSAVIGNGFALWWAYHQAHELTLVVQLVMTTGIRACGVFIASRWLEHPLEGASTPFRTALSFGLRLVPINTSSYLSRSLDSGILPLVTPPLSSATYARSYQLITAPVTQVQASLGPAILNLLGGFRRRSPSLFRERLRLFWSFTNIALTVIAGCVVLGSSLISNVIFGPKWPDAEVTISAMSIAVPGLATASFCAWSAQIAGTLKSSWTHALILILTPLSVIAGAAFGGYPMALVVVMWATGIVQPFLLLSGHRKHFPGADLKGFFQVSVQFVVLFALYGIRFSS